MLKCSQKTLSDRPGTGHEPTKIHFFNIFKCGLYGLGNIKLNKVSYQHYSNSFINFNLDTDKSSAFI